MELWGMAMRWILAPLPFLVLASSAYATTFVPYDPAYHSCAGYFPASAIKAHLEGNVKLSFRIRIDGTVANVEIAKSSGNVDFDRAAIACAKKWQYQPKTRHGKKIEVPWQALVEFRRND
jgi:protein TonB